jgi:hypothetical protein
MFKKGLLRVRTTVAALTFAAIVATSAVALAVGGVSGATIGAIQIVTSSNTATVFFTPGLSNPACQVGTAMVFDHTTARGKSLMTLITSAQLSGKKMDFIGTGTCQTISGLTWENISQASLTNN